MDNDTEIKTVVIELPPVPYVTETMIPVSALYKSEEEERFFDVEIGNCSDKDDVRARGAIAGTLLRWGWRAGNSTILGYVFLCAICAGTACALTLLFGSLYLKDMVFGAVDVDVVARQIVSSAINKIT